MSNTIPPLLCSTPPPIDFDGGGGSGSPDNDDFEPFESADSVYGQFDGPSKTHTPQHSLSNAKHDLDLPIPDLTLFPTCLPINTTTDAKLEGVKDDPGGVELTLEIFDDPVSQLKEMPLTSTDTSTEQNYKSILSKDPIEFVISEPPPVDVGYSSESQSPKNSRGDSPLSLEFSPGNISEDDSIDFQIENESRYDDNTSLPSLKFDAINTVSKSATPIPEDKSITNEKEADHDDDDDEDEKAADTNKECSKTSAFDTTAPTTKAEEYVLNTTLVPSDLTDSDEENDTIPPAQFTGEDCSNRPVDIESSSSKSDSGVIEEAVVDQREAEASDLNENAEVAGSKDAFHQPHEIISNETKPDPDSGASNELDEFTSFSWSDPQPSTSTIDKSSDEVNNGEFTFEADFSQAGFAAFENFTTPSIEPSIPETSTLQTDPIDGCDDDDFDDFQDFATAKEADVEKSDIGHENEAVSSEVAAAAEINTCENDDDDDFGDFNDFQESSVSHQATATVAPPLPIMSQIKIDEKVKTVLDAMFPSDSDSSTSAESSTTNSDLKKLSDNELTVNLREIDSAKALEYQWLRSSMKNSLVKSLGIDSRNILYGEKWNTSMPRFAANLGCGPLEPLKPMKLGSENVLMRSSKTTHSSIEPDKPTSSSSQVPAVKFDWNSSGLVNPLDGVKEILHERKIETIHPSQPDDTNRSGDPTSTDKNPAKAEQTIADNITSLSSFDHDLNPLEAVVTKDTVAVETNSAVEEDFTYAEQYTESPPTILTTSKFIPLKETHIFTPSKSENSISRSVHKTVSKGPIDFDYEIAAAGIVINEQVVKKEYRDIVYNLDAQTNDCSEVMPAADSLTRHDQNMPMVDPNKMGFRQTSVATDLLSGPILNIMEKKPAETLQSNLGDEFRDFQGSASKPPSSSESTTQSIATIASRSDVKNPDDDDFTEFQSVPPPNTSQQKSSISDKPKSRTGTPSLNEEMILSPAVLLPQAIKIQSSEPKIHWPSDSDINPEELARLEQLFPQAKQTAQQQSVFHNSSASAVAIPRSSSSPKMEKKDDDDWSDFVSVQPSLNSADLRLQDRPIPSSSSTSKLSTISKTYDDDDWSDFVSGTPATVSNMGPPSASKSSWNSMQLPPPQFNSWNQPPVPYNHMPSLATSQGFASVPSAAISQQQFHNMTTVPTMPANNRYQINHNNKFLVNGLVNPSHVGNFPQHHDTKGVNHLQYQQQQLHLNQQQKQQQHQRMNVNLNANVNVLRSQLNMAPSISLLPDLGFAAPKSLVNLSRTNASNKK